ncbi:MAG: STAS domain-containing protein [Simkaniaceae bacterium]|nr:STAS domain-containing protein [Simkaniaceae bacterium]
MSVGLNILEDLGEGHTILRIEGRLDATSASLLESKLQGLFEANRMKVLIDFSKIDYLSSAGMRVLLASTKKWKGMGGRLVFFSIGDDVMEIIKMAGFERILNISNNEMDAKKAA